MSRGPRVIGGGTYRKLPTLEVQDLPTFSFDAPMPPLPTIEYRIYTAAPPVVIRGPIVPKLYTFTPRIHVFKRKGLKIDQLLNLSEDLDESKERRDKERRERIAEEERAEAEEAAARRARAVKAAKDRADRLAEETEAAIQAAEAKEAKRKMEVERQRKARAAQLERENQVRLEKEKIREEARLERGCVVEEKEEEREFSAERAEYEFEQCMKKYKLVKANRYTVEKGSCRCTGF